ncbi:(deoxy)nucleoside triphosphate pyrophosphohydrolase [Hymenobacter canadensis]|uniref:8-oxo-dGTP diphosphatase n=1 Tax=Hymenobacter canadensis TaxID=2999067 RepID=A0ABY7LWP5_9BACT|nr:(deoxy)nucleoside triphosphate pyrophosphohydrolase [Hymenobacter canadensis]WBA44337.1 (deoxy)nucleoside triphosphate pyrophosphohydrolase [Hymenobacter canadensis]
MKHHEVVAAIIVDGPQILCLQRGPSKYEYIAYKYEFPGGKVEAGETQQQALVREIKEELELDIQVGEHFMTVEHEYADFKITMHAFLCQAGKAQLTLHEHVAYQWLPAPQLPTLDWAAADIPFVAKLVAQ